ncbi:MAG: hypothetical protein LBR21_03755 [Propionibacteriaceae bacterium]|jgi:hypothetical protein|nr:hypothetical protein [Propionibacteriaceae bacterium]
MSNTPPVATATEAKPMTFPKHVLAPAVLGLIGSIAGPIMGVAALDTVVGLVIGTHDDGNGHSVGGWNTTPLLAGVIYCASVAAAWEVGKAFAVRRGDKTPSRFHQVEAWSALILWLGLGVLMAAIRWNEDALAGGQSEGGQDDWVIALLLLALDLIAGACVMSAAYNYLDSSYHRVRPTQKRRSRAETESHKASGLALHVVEALDTNRLAASQWAAETKTRYIRLGNETARIKDSIRLEAARILGNPPSTGSVFEPHRPTNAAE